MLTMDGVRLLNEWGVEPQQLEVEYQDATDYGSGRAVGFHGYREHPIYDGLHGGAYVWKATVDNFARNWGFSGTNLPQAEGAKVVGEPNASLICKNPHCISGTERGIKRLYKNGSCIFCDQKAEKRD